MLTNEQLEMLGMASAIGRLQMALKQTEDVLLATREENIKLKDENADLKRLFDKHDDALDSFDGSQAGK